jgi:hypothetical protein
MKKAIKVAFHIRVHGAHDIKGYDYCSTVFLEFLNQYEEKFDIYINENCGSTIYNVTFPVIRTPYEKDIPYRPLFRWCDEMLLKFRQWHEATRRKWLSYEDVSKFVDL